MKCKFVFFDCDGVLTFDYLWKKLDNSIGIPPSLARKWKVDYYEGKIDFRKYNSNFTTYYRKQKLTLNMLNQTIKDISVNPETIEVIEYLKKINVGLAIISSGLAEYVEKYANLLKIDIWRANSRMAFDKKGEFLRLYCKADDPIAKVLEVEEICSSKNINPTETIFIGDDVNDSKVFELTEHGLLYKNSKQVSIDSTWDVINNLNEVKQFIEIS